MQNIGVILFTASPHEGASDEGALVKVDGREALLRSVDLFLNRESIARVVLAMDASRAEDLKQKFSSHLMFAGVKVASGGADVASQVRAGLEKMPAEATRIVIHDAARPAVSAPQLDDFLESCQGAPGLVMTAPLLAPVVSIGTDGSLNELRGPVGFRQLLWPMALSREDAEIVAKEGIAAVLDRVRAFDSSVHNVRVNTAGDAASVKSAMALLPKPKPRVQLSPFEEAKW